MSSSKRKGKRKARRGPARRAELESQREPEPEPEPAEPARRAGRREDDEERLPLVRERSWGRLAGLAGVFGVVATFVAIGFANAASGEGPSSAPLDQTGGRDVDRAERLTDYAENDGLQAIAASLHTAGLLASIAVGLYLFWLVRNRDEHADRRVLALSIAGPLVFASAAALGFLALRDVSGMFVGLPSGEQTPDRAEGLMTDSTLFQIAQALDIAGRLVFAAWVWLISRAAMRVELLTPFLGIWGIGTAFVLVLGILGFPIGEAMYIGWLASVAILALGWWPGGRPDGWTMRVQPV